MTRDRKDIIKELSYKIDHTKSHLELSVEFCKDNRLEESHHVLLVSIAEFSNILGLWNSLTVIEKKERNDIFNKINNIKTLIEQIKDICPLETMYNIEYVS